MLPVLLLLGQPSSAHTGLVFGVWQWPTSHLPELDGDISEWEVIPDSLWWGPERLRLWITLSGDFANTIPEGADEPTVDFRVAFAWNDEFNRLYIVQDRSDDIWDRDNGGDGCCGGDDSIEIGIDADHTGGRFWFSEENEEAGRRAGSTHYRWPSMRPQGWRWEWTSMATWQDKEPYACCIDSYTLEGEHGSEATLKSEWYTITWDVLDISPESSVPHDLAEGQIIGLALSIIDNDIGESATWTLGGDHRVDEDAAFFSDFFLLPVQWDLLPPSPEEVPEPSDTTDVDNEPPFLNSVGNRTVAEGEVLAFNITASDPDGDELEFSARALPAGAQLITSEVQLLDNSTESDNPEANPGVYVVSEGRWPWQSFVVHTSGVLSRFDWLREAAGRRRRTSRLRCRAGRATGCR